jgi:hypothetical protein
MTIFPRLRAFSLPPLIIPPHFMQPFLSLNLQRVTLNTVPAYCTSSYLTQILHQSPQISHLRLYGPISSKQINLITSFKHLVEIQLYFSSSWAYSSAQILTVKAALSTFLTQCHLLPRLTSFLLSISFDIDHICGQTPLSTIKSLEIHGRPTTIKTLLSHSGAVETVVLSSNDATTTDWLHCSEILLRTSAATLRSLTFVSNDFVHLSRCLSPLLNIRHLESFRVILHNGILLDLDDVDIRNIVHAWPLLQRLVLPTEGLSVSCFNSLAQLEHLHILHLTVSHEIARLPMDAFPSRDSLVHKCMTRVFTRAQLYGRTTY